jgi:hypothetical protein
MIIDDEIWKHLPNELIHTILYHGPMDIRIQLHIPPRKLRASDQDNDNDNMNDNGNEKRKRCVHKISYHNGSFIGHRVFFVLLNGRRMVLYDSSCFKCVNCFDCFGSFENHWATDINDDGGRVMYYYDRDALLNAPTVSYQMLVASQNFESHELDIIRLD